MSVLLWVAVPYGAFASFVLGHIWRYRFDRFGWDARNKRDSRTRRVGLRLFRIGILALILSRVFQFAASDARGDAVAALCSVADVVGAVAVVAAVGGVVVLLTQRIATPGPARRMNPLDRMMLPMLGATLLCGMAIMFGPNSGGVDYLPHTTLFPWARSLIALDPQPDLMASAPLIAQLRALLLMVLMAMWPYTRLVHVFTEPLGQLLRLRPHLRLPTTRAQYPKAM